MNGGRQLRAIYFGAQSWSAFCMCASSLTSQRCTLDGKGSHIGPEFVDKLNEEPTYGVKFTRCSSRVNRGSERKLSYAGLILI